MAYFVKLINTGTPAFFIVSQCLQLRPKGHKINHAFFHLPKRLIEALFGNSCNFGTINLINMDPGFLKCSVGMLDYAFYLMTVHWVYLQHVLRELPSSPVPASCCTALLEAYSEWSSMFIFLITICFLQ